MTKPFLESKELALRLVLLHDRCNTFLFLVHLHFVDWHDRYCWLRPKDVGGLVDDALDWLDFDQVRVRVDSSPLHFASGFSEVEF